MPRSSTSRTRLSEMAIEKIKEIIVSQNMGPGSKLPSERHLVDALGVGRSSVREALRILEIMGLVEVQPGKGAFVKALTGDLFMPLSDLLHNERESLQHHFEARMVLEPTAAALAAKRASGAEVAQLRKNIQTFQDNLASNNLVGLIRADIQFHRLVANATENRTIEVCMNTITRHDFRGWKAALRTQSRPMKTINEHSRIVEAIAQGDDKKARAAMRNHLMAAKRNLGLLNK
jgi:GntR family transcriptional repressor for pyruvate dehydrogenase complex